MNKEIKLLIIIPIFSFLIVSLLYNLEILSYYKIGQSNIIENNTVIVGESSETTQNKTMTTNTITRFFTINPPIHSNRNYSNFTTLILISILVILFISSVYILSNLASGKPSFRFKLKKTYSSSSIVEFKKILEKNIEELKISYQKSSNPILGLYKEVCNFLISRGIEDAPHLTAREFEDNVYKILNFKPRSFSKLTLLFEEARYSNHEISQDKVNLARELVEDIIKELKEKL